MSTPPKRLACPRIGCAAAASSAYRAEALASLLRTVVVALFLLTFVLQPYLIPSESMEHTLLVGDFLLVNKQIYAPSGGLGRLLMPYREIARATSLFSTTLSTPISSSG